METAICRVCRTRKSLEEFNPSSLRNAKRSGPACRRCANERQKAWRDANREKARGYGRAWYLRNKEQAAAASAAWERRNREKRTARLRDMRATGWKVNYDLVTRYGITVEEFQELLNIQGGRCACCGAEGLGGRMRLHVDHDHASGIVRGLLCKKCNGGIGLLGDTRDGVVRALAYLDRSRDGLKLDPPCGIGEGMLH